MFGDLGVLGIDQAVGDEEVLVGVVGVAHVGVVPPEVARVDEDRVLDIEVLHLLDVVFDRRVHAGTLEVGPLGVVEGEARLRGPELDVGVDDEALLGGSGLCDDRTSGSQGPGGLGEEVSSCFHGFTPQLWT